MQGVSSGDVHRQVMAGREPGTALVTDDVQRRPTKPWQMQRRMLGHHYRGCRASKAPLALVAPASEAVLVRMAALDALNYPSSELAEQTESRGGAKVLAELVVPETLLRLTRLDRQVAVVAVNGLHRFAASMQ